MSALQKRFLKDLADFIALAETIQPDVRVIQDSCAASVRAQNELLQKQQKKLAQIQLGIRSTQVEADTATSFLSSVHKTLDRVQALSSPVQAFISSRINQLRQQQKLSQPAGCQAKVDAVPGASPTTRENLKQQQQQRHYSSRSRSTISDMPAASRCGSPRRTHSQDAKRKKRPQSAPSAGSSTHFENTFHLNVRKTSAMIGLALENDRFGVRIAELESSLQQGPCNVWMVFARIHVCRS